MQIINANPGWNLTLGSFCAANRVLRTSTGCENTVATPPERLPQPQWMQARMRWSSRLYGTRIWAVVVKYWKEPNCKQ